MKAPTLGLRLLPRAVNGSTNARPMHSSAAQAAKVVPIVGTGPPPEPPLPVARPSNDRIERRKRQAELLRATRVIRNADSGKVTTLRKRFWKDVSVNEVNGEPPSLCDNGASLCGNGASLCGNRGRARGPVSVLTGICKAPSRSISTPNHCDTPRQGKSSASRPRSRTSPPPWPSNGTS